MSYKNFKISSLFSLRGIMGFLLISIMTTSCNKPLTSGIDPTNLDTTAVPGTDFYQYACGGWMEKNPLTGEYSRFGSFDKLAENNRQQLRDLIEEIASKPTAEESVEQKIGDLFNLAMDSVKLNKDGISPIKKELEKIASLKSADDIMAYLPEMMTSGLSPFFAIYIDADPMSSNDYLVQTYQGGISLSEREYYLDEDAHTKDIRDKYKAHVVKMFQLVGLDEQKAKENMAAVMTIETRLAKSAYDNVKLRDPHANYNKMSIDEVQKLVPTIQWKEFLSALGMKNAKEISISQKEAVQEVGNIIKTEPIASQIA